MGYGGDMADLAQLVAALASRVEALEAVNDSLRSQLDAARAGLDLTMRGQGRCRACGGTDVLHANMVVDRGHGNYAEPLAVSVKGWLSRAVGAFETYICVACGLVEWYVKNPSELHVDGKQIERLEPKGPGGPYR
jgi:hypothetical protein